MSGFTKRDRKFDDGLLLRSLTQNERRVIEFIFRLSHGCAGSKVKKYAILTRKKDFEACGIQNTIIDRTLKALIEKKVIFADKKKIKLGNKEQDVYLYSINMQVDTWDVPYINDYGNSNCYKHLLRDNLINIYPNVIIEMNNSFRIKELEEIIARKLELEYIDRTVGKIYKKNKVKDKKDKSKEVVVEKLDFKEIFPIVDKETILIGEDFKLNIQELECIRDIDKKFLGEALLYLDLLLIKQDPVITHNEIEYVLKKILTDYYIPLLNDSRVKTLADIEKQGFDEYLKQLKVYNLSKYFLIKNDFLYLANNRPFSLKAIFKLYTEIVETKLKFKDNISPDELPSFEESDSAMRVEVDGDDDYIMPSKAKEIIEDAYVFFHSADNFKNDKMQKFCKILFKLEFEGFKNKVEIENYSDLYNKFSILYDECTL